MRDMLPVLRMLGLLIMLFALGMLLPLGVSAWWHDGMVEVFARSLGETLLCGALLWGLARSVRRELQPRHGVLLVVLTWSVLPLLATLPLLHGLALVGRPLDFAHALYETTSGLSTSGGTALTGLDTLPVSINFWRCLLQWLGGMGILVVVVAVLPLLGMGGSQLFRAESAGPMKETKLTPRIAETAKGLWAVYAGLSLLCALGYWAAGMTPMDAVMHMFTTVSLGGMSSHDASFAYFHSGAIEAVAVVIMLAASCNFALYFSAFARRRADVLWRNPELQLTLLLLFGGGVLVGCIVWLGGSVPFWQALRLGVFHTVSIGSTTGFVTTDFEQWPPFAPLFILLLSSFATSAGSTGGGLKLIRVMVLVQQTRYELMRMVHSRVVRPPHLGTARIPEHIVRAVVAYAVLYVGTTVAATLALRTTGLDLQSAFGATLASINCVGTGLSKVGPASNYAALSGPQVLVCCACMVLGRIELLSFFALLMPGFWRR